MTTNRRGVAELYATLVILSITLSMSYLIYSELRVPRTGDQATFLNEASLIGGSPELVLLRVVSSKPTTLVSVDVDNVSSGSGFLALGKNGYASSPTPCGAGLDTFFSVQAPSTTQVNVRSDGSGWIAGAWRDSAQVGAGWSELILHDASSCNISGGTVSRMPLTAAPGATEFTLYLPVAGGTHSALLVFTGGFDRVAFSA